MKTNPAARGIRKLRIELLCLAFLLMAGLELGAGQALASRFGQGIPCQSNVRQAPSMAVSELMAAMR
jgi:hypothetical protein